jgi:hypothetical protein
MTLSQGYGARLDTDAKDWLVRAGCGDCDIWFQDALIPGNSNMIAVLSPSDRSTYATCAAVTQYESQIQQDRLMIGFRACIKTTKGSLALVRVTKIPRDSNGYPLSISVDVTVWPNS